MTSAYRRTSRTIHAWKVWLIATTVMTGLVVTASSGPVHVWTNPDLTVAEPPAAGEGGNPIAPPPAEPIGQTDPMWIGTVLQTVAIVIFGLIILAAAYLSSQWMRAVNSRRRERRRERFAEPLPDAADGRVQIDADAARASLPEGSPRNGIVACWIQLESDVAAAGLPRHVSETSSEYTERVIGQSSIDAGPITELAALYREARFSNHALAQDHRARAAQALDRVVAALNQHDRSIG